MKKFLSIIVVAVMLCLTACGSSAPEATDSTKKDTAAEQVTADNSENNTTAATTETSTKKDATETVKETVKETAKVTELPLPFKNTDFSLLSGAGAWRTAITLNKDGSFTGIYLDSEMAEAGEDYPNGSAYICEFSGKFDDFEKINDYSYRMTLADLKSEKAFGEEWIEDGIRYISSLPNGFMDSSYKKLGTEFILYLPENPVNELTEDFLSWWPYGAEQETNPKTTLSCFGIQNVATNDGFFTAE